MESVHNQRALRKNFDCRSWNVVSFIGDSVTSVTRHAKWFAVFENVFAVTTRVFKYLCLFGNVWIQKQILT